MVVPSVVAGLRLTWLLGCAFDAPIPIMIVKKHGYLDFSAAFAAGIAAAVAICSCHCEVYSALAVLGLLCCMQRAWGFLISFHCSLASSSYIFQDSLS